MKNIFVLLALISILSCSTESPISGVYQTKDGEISANILDSCLYLLIGIDTAIIYDLQIHSKHQYDSITYRIYNVVYRESINRNGFESFDIPISFEYSPSHGGTLIASFINDHSFILGGYVFRRQKNEAAKKIFDNWSDFIMNNTQTRIWTDHNNN